MKKFLSLLCLLSFISMHMPALAFEKDSLSVNQTQVPLSTQLKKYYNGYEYNIQNNSDKPINIVSAQILNGNDGGIAFTTTMNNEPSAMARTWIIAGPIGLFTLGAGWVLGLIATPFVAIASNSNKRKTQTESIGYSNIIQLGVIPSGENIKTSTLVPIGSKPQLKVTVQDTQTKALETYTY